MRVCMMSPLLGSSREAGARPQDWNTDHSPLGTAEAVPAACARRMGVLRRRTIRAAKRPVR